MDSIILLIAGILIILAGLFLLFCGIDMFYLVISHTNHKDPIDDILSGILWLIISLFCFWRGSTFVMDA